MGDITGDYVWHMEDVLYQYQLPYDVRHPLLCFDERPCFLIEDVGGILPMIYEVSQHLWNKAGARQVKNAEVGLAHNLGGPGSVGCVTILANK